MASSHVPRHGLHNVSAHRLDRAVCHVNVFSMYFRSLGDSPVLRISRTPRVTSVRSPREARQDWPALVPISRFYAALLPNSRSSPGAESVAPDGTHNPLTNIGGEKPPVLFRYSRDVMTFHVLLRTSEPDGECGYLIHAWLPRRLLHFSGCVICEIQSVRLAMERSSVAELFSRQRWSEHRRHFV